MNWLSTDTERRRGGGMTEKTTDKVVLSETACMLRWQWVNENCGIVQQPKYLRQRVFTYAGLSSSISAVVESGSKSKFFLTLCLGDFGLPGPDLPLFVSYSWQQKELLLPLVTGKPTCILNVQTHTRTHKCRRRGEKEREWTWRISGFKFHANVWKEAHVCGYKAGENCYKGQSYPQN